MGGIPTNVYGEVQDTRQRVVEGLYAVGECAAASFHGFNRLGTNSILELITMGKYVGNHVIERLSKESSVRSDVKTDRFREKFTGYFAASGQGNIGQIRDALRTVMTDKVSVFRTKTGLTEAIETLRELKVRSRRTQLSGKSLAMNQELVQRWEIDNLLAVSMAICEAALHRKESRGAHFRDDFPARSDEYNYHTLVSMPDFGNVEFGRREVDMSIFQAKGEKYEKFGIIERKY
jgi:succinate dehydrogenase / fumarate reductase flavoprotein subunit